MDLKCLPLLSALLAAGVLCAAPTSAEPVDVSFDNGLLSIHCRNAPLSSVFEQIEDVAGVELILEDAVKSKRLDADLEELPVAMAVQRLLEGSGVNYIVMMDPHDWGRVGKVFVGAGGGGPSRPAPPPRRPAVRPAEPADDFDDLDDAEEMDDFDDTNDMDGDLVDDPDAEDPGAFPSPPGSSPIPNYLPAQQSFPRSNFTPGPPSTVQPRQQTPNPSGNPSASPPPATFPFMDALGRPIPIPPDVQQQQQEERRRQQQQRQQQQR